MRAGAATAVAASRLRSTGDLLGGLDAKLGGERESIFLSPLSSVANCLIFIYFLLDDVGIFPFDFAAVSVSLRQKSKTEINGKVFN
jgi:hypothetical protein